MSQFNPKTPKKKKQKTLKQGAKKAKNPSADISNLHKSIGNKAVESLLSPNKDSLKKEESIENKQPKDTNKKEKNLAPIEEIPIEEKLIKTPTNPHQDKAFNQSIKSIKNSAKNLKKHPTGDSQLSELKDASYLEESEQSKNNDQKIHFDSIENSSKLSKEKKFTAEAFKESLKKELKVLKNTLPTDADGVKKFKNNKPIEAVKKNITTEVSQEKEKITGTLEIDAQEKNPKKSKKLTIKAKGIKKKLLGIKPKSINSKASTPKPKQKNEISMEKENKSLDEYMKENTLTETQLSQSNEPKFLQALNRKTEAQKKLKEAPKNYRTKERKLLGTAKKEASALAQKEFGLMFSSRKDSFESIYNKQTDSKKSSQSEKKRINAEFEKIYKKTKEAVSSKLAAITTKVDELFNDGGEVDNAKKRFEKNVEERLEDIHGLGVSAFFFGEDTEAIEKVFQSEKQLFIAKLDTIFDDIAKIISTGLNLAMSDIAKGRQESKIFYEGLDKKEKDLAKDSLDTFNDRYDSLEENVSTKEKELSQGLARKYKENINRLRETFDAIKKRVTATWLDVAINAIKGVIETIKKLRQLISDLLSAIQSILPKILENPLWFVKTLFKGITEGIELFKKNIKKHLIGGFIKWLTGAMGSMNISIPKDIFSLKGIFSLVMQILGLGWDYVRKKSVKLLGEPLVNAMETSVEMFKLFRTKGATAIWEHLKEKFNDLKETIMGEIKQMLITQVIMAGIKWMVSLLVPGGGFVKTIMAIKDLIVFFVESAMMLIPTLIKAIKALASGNVKGVSTAIEEGLSRLIAVIINLFAKLIGLGGLAKKVMNIIKRIRKRIDKALNKLIFKARKSFKGLVKKGKTKVKGAIKKLISWFKIKVGFKAKDGKKHSLNIEGSEKKPQLIIRSEPIDFDTFAKDILAGEDKEKNKLVNDALVVYRNWRTEVNKKVPKDDENGKKKKANKIEKYMKKLSLFIAKLFGHSNKDLPEYKKGTNVLYESVNTEGVGEKMEALVLSKKGKKGSVPTIKNDTYTSLFKRKKGAGVYYVRGHLLNENIHGPGNDFKNLTPLSVKGNKNHLQSVESILKFVVSVGAVVRYSVDPIYKDRGLKTEDSMRPKKFSDEEWEELKEIRKVESKAVPTHLKIDAYLMEKDEKSKFKFKDKKPIYTKEVDNPIETDIDSYTLGEGGSSKERFILKGKSAITIVEELEGISLEEAQKIVNRLEKSQITNYQKQIGISKKDLDEKNPQYNIVGS